MLAYVMQWGECSQAKRLVSRGVHGEQVVHLSCSQLLWKYAVLSAACKCLHACMPASCRLKYQPTMSGPITSKPKWCRRPLPYPEGSYGKYAAKRYDMLRRLPESLARECWEANVDLDLDQSWFSSVPGVQLGVPDADGRDPCAGQKLADAGQEPAEAGQKPAEAGQELADAGQESAEAGQKPAEAGQEPAASGQVLQVFQMAKVFEGVPGVPAGEAAHQEPAAASKEPADAGQEPAAAGKETADAAGQDVFEGVHPRPSASVSGLNAAAAVSPFATLTGGRLTAAVRGGTSRATIIWTLEPPAEVRRVPNYPGIPPTLEWASTWAKYLKWLQWHGRWELRWGEWVYQRLW